MGFDNFIYSYFTVPDIGPIEETIYDNLWLLYSLYPQNDECDQIQENQELCKNLLKSAQSSFRLAVREWNNLLVKMNRQCRTNVLLKDVEEHWGNKVKMSRKQFQEKMFTEIVHHRRRRVAFIVGFLGVLVATAIFSAISYGIAKAVVSSEIDDLEAVFEKSTDIISDELNKTEEYLKELDSKVQHIDVRLSNIERYVQLNDYGSQSSQEAVSLTEFVLSKIYLQENQYPLLDLEFKNVFEDEISSQSGLDLEARNLQIFKLKQLTTYVSWINQGEDFKCSTTSVSTIMVAPVMESDTSQYKALNNSDGYISDDFDNRITYQNRYGLQIIEDSVNIAGLGPKKTLLANRRFTSIEDTRIVFTEARNQISDRLTVFFLRNQTEKRLATIQCSNSSSMDSHQFTSGTTIELPIYCSIFSFWLNASAIRVRESKHSLLGGNSFNLKWKPISSPAESNTTEFTGNMSAVSEEMHIIREDFKNRHVKISTQELLGNIVKVAEKTASIGEKVFNHFSDHGPTYGIGSFSFLSVLVSIFLFLKKRRSNSGTAIEKGNFLSIKVENIQRSLILLISEMIVLHEKSGNETGVKSNNGNIGGEARYLENETSVQPKIEAASSEQADEQVNDRRAPFSSIQSMITQEASH